MKLPISETFTSIQGEGRYTGTLSRFVRVSGCNLRCWWCDTPYTSWKPEMGNMVEVGEVVKVALAGDVQHVVVTGGEPTLYMEELALLVAELRYHNRVVTIETNGTRYHPSVEPDLWSVSPKLASSLPSLAEHPAEHTRHGFEMANIDLRNFLPVHTHGATQFKFVVSNQEDVYGVLELCEEFKLPSGLVWLMPEGRTRDQVLAKAEFVVGACKEHGFNYSARVHTLIWGERRGV